jgi:hypothetical protein
MTFLSEGVGMPKSGGARDAILISLAQSVSCLGGLIFPFCPGPISWGFWMTVSMVTYLAMFWRVHAKRRLYLAERRKVGRSFIDKEHLDRVEFAYHLIVACCFFWTVLVIVYFINMALHLSLSPDHPWLQRDFSLAMLCDTVFDVLAKGIYMKLIVDVHFCVFDAEGRAQRQLGELRSLMSVLWDSSSDAIVISARSGDRVTSLLSPSFVRLAELPVPEQLVDRRGMALLLEVECQNRGVTSSPDNPQGASGFEIVSGSFVDCSEIPYGGLRGERMLAEADFNSNRSHEKALEVSDLICAAWNHSDLSNSEAVLMFQLCARRCEVKVSPHTDEMLVAVIRDVTERFKRLEAERKAHVEMVARQKEAQSVRRRCPQKGKARAPVLRVGSLHRLLTVTATSTLRLEMSVITDSKLVSFDTRSRTACWQGLNCAIVFATPCMRWSAQWTPSRARCRARDPPIRLAVAMMPR